METALPLEVSGHSHDRRRQIALTLGALGVVYGDIGTSPLYALKECLSKHYGIAPNASNVLGLLSLMTWSLTMVVTVKYLGFIMRATNHGEGGVLTLLALCPMRLRVGKPGQITLTTGLVIFGAALLYGDGMITPAVSVLSAVEGLGVATHKLEAFVVPITCVIILALFSFQRIGTGRVGALFGPVMLVWFSVLAGLGIYHTAQNPSVLAALSPHHAVLFLISNGKVGFAVLGSVVLCVTGGEALYADMGHFGAPPIRRAWLAMVMPALLLAYFGQGANVLTHPEAIENPFYALVPVGLPLYALVALSTLAAVIASQALISGAFSLTHQAVQLGIFPRMTVRHTSATAEGQIYLSGINWTLAVACISLVLVFRSSTGLAAAYGIAVCGTMAITSMMFALVARQCWHWSKPKVFGILVLFLTFDLGFLAANLLKFTHGGYVPILIAIVISVVMVVWTIGRSNLAEYYAKRSVAWDDFKAQLEREQIARVDTLGVFMASDARGVPPMVSHQAERIRAIPKTALLMTVSFEHAPWIAESERIAEVKDLGHGFYRVIARYGFMQQADVPRVIAEVVRMLDLPTKSEDVTFYLGRESLVSAPGGAMGPMWEGMFRLLTRNTIAATAYFRLPPAQVVEIGIQIDL